MASTVCDLTSTVGWIANPNPLAPVGQLAGPPDHVVAVGDNADDIDMGACTGSQA